jgi:hypothetical protein
MTTIHNLQILAVDLEQRVVREMQFQGDAEQQVMSAFTTLREALANVENVVMNSFQERSRALAATLGTGKPSPDTFESEAPPIKIAPRVKVSRASQGDAEVPEAG